jgi:hypothetical protein
MHTNESMKCCIPWDFFCDFGRRLDLGGNQQMGAKVVCNVGSIGGVTMLVGFANTLPFRLGTHARNNFVTNDVPPPLENMMWECPSHFALSIDDPPLMWETSL